jgi:hypothetical protein
MAYRANPVDTVRALLREWTAYRRRWSPDIGYPHAVPWLDEVRGSVDGWTEGADYDLKIKANEMRQVDEAVRLELSHDHQHAIFVVYLNEVGPAVWRSARKPMPEIRRLCEEAELRLVPLLRRRDIAL